ncbi:O-antigen ligase family protein [Entomomonas asaccharolytica]|uniref:O-antigen ligase family protein n=1 Tax=Entomomonas asaccharolytica TaxID=2785331 RepID=A0A974NGJ2_9GAMM|nr:O-antigen ligase family protein [Entomomonas asaccharolytica]QQP86215.1 O-antigen ligase family protein [Entomomonas asaccharolytica]
MTLRKDLLVTLLLITVAPFCVFIHYAPLGDFWPFFIACSAVVICAVFILGINNVKQSHLLVSPLVGCLVGFFAVLCLLTVVQNSSLSDKATLVIYSVVVILTALLAIQLAHNNETQYYDYLAFILFIGGVVEALGAIAIQYRLAGIDYWMVPMSDRLIGFIAQSNQFAIYMMVAFLALCYLAFRNIFHIVVVIVFALLFGFVLLGSGSRAVLVYLVLACITAVFCLVKSKDKTYLKFIICLVALMVGALIYYFLPVVLQLFNDDTTQVATSNIASSLNRSAASESFRLSEISKAFAMVKQSPLIGVGFGNYAVHGFWVGVNDPNYTIIGDLTLHSHNLFTQIMTEFGLIGLLALLALLAYIVFCFWKAPKTLQWWLVLTIFLVYFINSMLEYVMWRMQFVPLIILVLVPLLSKDIKLFIPKIITSVFWIAIAGVFVVIANSSLNTYAKSFFYNNKVAVFDKGDYNKFKSATRDLLWGREVQLQEFANLSPTVNDFAYQQRVTDEMLAWRPYAPVIANKIQLSLLSGQIGDLDKLSHALARAYPTMVPMVCNYFKEFNNIPNLQGLRIVKKELNCRKLSSSQ